MSPTSNLDMSSTVIIDRLWNTTPKPQVIQPANDNEQHGKLDANALAALSHGNAVLPGIPSFDSVSKKRHWQLEHMAAAFRHWSRSGYVEGISGHMSVRDPEHSDCFWTNPFGVHFGLLKVSDMILVHLDGRIISSNNKNNNNTTTPPLNAAGFHIHAAIHKARPDIHAICHAHTVYGKAWSVFGRELDMLTQDACKFYKAHSVYNAYGGIVLAAEEGNRIASALGTNKACILRNHGLLTCGQTIDEAAFLFTALEHACQTQLLCEAAVAGGGNGLQKVVIGDEEAACNFATDSTPDVCYAEFQPYYRFEEHMAKGDFKE